MFDFDKFQNAVVDFANGVSLQTIYEAQNHTLPFQEWHKNAVDAASYNGVCSKKTG